MSEYYPRVTVSLSKLRNNVNQVLDKCKAQGIRVAGVIKGCHGLEPCAREFYNAGCSFIASSRLEQLAAVRDKGIEASLMLIRIPMLSEVDRAVELTDISLNSQPETLEALNKAAAKLGKIHQVILMVDLGDLREGFWDKDELLTTALMVERRMNNLELAGVGTNLGCYGAISATAKKLSELVTDAEMIEDKIGRQLKYIAGGATTSIPRILEGDMPERVNLLRIGEGILLGKDLRDLWGYNMDFLNQDVFTLEAEIIEIKDKPSHPVGEIMFDAYGFQPEYEDRGIRKRALLALGKVDYAFSEMIYPRDNGIEILGASSDHTIVDIEDAQREFKVGDTMKFDICYATMVYVTNSPNVKIVYED